MPLLDHFHPPLHGPRRWEGFLNGWAALIAAQLNQGILPSDYFAEPEIKLGPVRDTIEIRVCQLLGEAELRAAVELVTPANKDCTETRRRFATICARYLQRGIGIAFVDVVTESNADLHGEMLELMGVGTSDDSWKSPTGLSAVAYRKVLEPNRPHLEVWSHVLTLGQALPVLPLWLTPELCLPLRLEESYTETCRSLRISV